MTCSWVEGLVARGLRDLRGLPRDSLVSGTSSCEKLLEKFSKFFLSSVLTVGPSDLLTTWLSCENRVFCANRLVFKRFQFFPLNFYDCSLSSLPETLSNSPCHSLNKLPFLHHFNSKYSRKRYEFSLFLYKLYVLCLVYLNLWVVDLIWDICCFSDGLDVCLLCLDFWVLLIRLLDRKSVV